MSQIYRMKQNYITLAMKRYCKKRKLPFFSPIALQKTWFYKNGCISTNYGPILKIQNLAAQGFDADL